MTFCSAIYALTTIWICLFQSESSSAEKSEGEPDGNRLSITEVYYRITQVMKQSHMKELMFILLVVKVGCSAIDSAAELVLLNYGIKREDLALLALLNLPFQIAFAVISGNLSSGKEPLRPWLSGYLFRVIIASLYLLFILLLSRTEEAAKFVNGAPSSAVTPTLPTLYLFFIFCFSLALSFGSSLMMVSQGGFFARISDSSIGATYLTLLNTVANFGGTWPEFFVFYLIDFFSMRFCRTGINNSDILFPCNLKHEKKSCKKYGGLCVIERDGFFLVCFFCLFLGAVLLLIIRRKVFRLQKVPLVDWKSL